jgi:hypothetical protein
VIILFLINIFILSTRAPGYYMDRPGADRHVHICGLRGDYYVIAVSLHGLHAAKHHINLFRGVYGRLLYIMHRVTELHYNQYI